MLGQHFPALAEAKHRFAHTLKIGALHPFQQLQRRGEHEPWVCFFGFGKSFLWLVCLLEKICFFLLGGQRWAFKIGMFFLGGLGPDFVRESFD